MELLDLSESSSGASATYFCCWALNHIMQYQLIFRFRKVSIEYPDEIQSLERELSNLLGDSAKLDGYDTGAREINLFIMTAEPASIFRRSKAVLERLSLLDKVTAAYRLEGGVRFTVIWPVKYNRKFSLQ